MSTPNNPPAFPFGQISERTGMPVNGFYDPGMTLRDYFAAKALAQASDNDESVQSASRELGIKADEYSYRIHWPMLLAKRAYAIADAMLAERAKGAK